MKPQNGVRKLNISLEPHLVDALKPLVPLIPPNLADNLSQYIAEQHPGSIPYSVLNAISQWSRTPSGRERLECQSPPLEPHAYSIISLLAGTTSSPEGKFGEYIAKESEARAAARNVKERKAVTALLNALLSICGSGFATWWAADKTGWKNEWRVLLALLVAIVVAIAEGVLYLIWQNRQSSIKTRTRMSAVHKRVDGEPESASNEISEQPAGLRHRK